MLTVALLFNVKNNFGVPQSSLALMVKSYCSGLTVPSQVEIEAELERTTASAKEQK
jgi:hypothetical protein